MRSSRPTAPQAAVLAATAVAAFAAGFVVAGAREDAPARGGQVAAPFPPRAAEPGRAPVPRERAAGRSFRVGGRPEGIAVDPESGLAAVSLGPEGAVALVDARTGAVRRRVDLPAQARHLTLARPGGPFLLGLEDANLLAELSPLTRRVRYTPAGGHPHDVTAAGGRVYVGDEFASTLTVLRDGRREAVVPVDSQPGGVVATGGVVAVVSVRAYTVELFRRRDLAALGSQNAGAGPTHVVADPAGRLYVADTRGGALLVYSSRPALRPLARVALGGAPYGLALDARRGRLWVTLTARNRIVELTLGERPRVLRELPTVRQPNSAAVDPRDGAVLVTSRTDGTVQRIPARG